MERNTLSHSSTLLFVGARKENLQYLETLSFKREFNTVSEKKPTVVVSLKSYHIEGKEFSCFAFVILLIG